MDPALWELTKGAADEEIRAIIRLHDGEAVPEHVRIVARFGNIATVRMQRGQIIEVHSAANVASLKARRFVVPDDEIMSADEEPASAELFTSRRPHEATETGQGVIVGCADWGVDFVHPDFRRADGSTRLLALWDQAAPFDAKHDNRYGYGAIHTAAEINQALATADPYAALNYYPYRSDLGGAGAHGAHVLSIAAGSRYGVAPNADLVFVHMSSDQATGGLANLGDSVTVLEAVDFIFRTADAYGKPCVCNLSMGRHSGPHDGNTLVERGFDAALTERAGRAIVQSTGNYFDLAIHASGQLRPGESKRLSFEVDEADHTPNELEVWYPGSDRLVVELIQPDGTRTRRVPLDDSVAVHADSQEIGKLYHRARDPNTFDNHINLFLYPGAPSGIWQLVLVAEDVVDGRYNAWIERDAICLGCQVRFDPRDADTNSTTGTICNGFRTIAVGAYNPHTPDRELAPFSSSGPTRDGRGKPDLVAPGYRIRAARSAPRDLPDNAPLSTVKSGTSMAVPHVTGTVALMFEAATRPLSIQETRNLLIGTTDPAPVDRRDGDRHRFGSGYLNSDAAIAATRAYTAASTDNERSTALFQHTPHEAAVNIEHNGKPAMTHDNILFFDDAEDLGDDQFDRLEAYAASRDDWIDDDNEDDSADESRNAFGQLRIEAVQYPVVALSTTPDYTTNNLDDALQFALNQRDSHTLITGDIFTGMQFAVYCWRSGPLPSTPSVVEFDAAATVAMLILNGVDAYMPSNPLTRMLRWVKLNRPREFYSLAERDRRRQRRRWIQRIYAARDAIVIPNVTITRAWLNGLSMPALRLLLAQFAAAIFRVRNIDQNNDRGRFRGGEIRGVTLPVLRAPLSEPDCYLPVISGREGQMESINAYDEGAGVSLGPIQFTVINAYLFRFLWSVWRDDAELFNQAFGALNWTMRQHGDHPDLLVDAGAANAIVLHGRRNDRERNVGYFQSGTPGVTDFDQIDAAFRRDLTARFRTLVVWPHIQEKIIETSAEYLAPGLQIIHRPEYGIPALDPANPDRDAFILKALLLSAYVRYNACLRPFLAALQNWTTPAEKLRNWRNALNTQQNWGVCNRRRRDRLLQRLGAQEREAEQVYEMLLRAMGRSSTDEQESDTIWQDDHEAMDDILEYDNEDVDWIDTQLDTPDTVPLIEQAMGRADDWLSAATLFDAFTGTSRAAERRAFAEQFSLVARPGAPLSTPLHAGDLVVRRALGEGMAGHIALVAEPTLRTAAEATAAGLTPESMRAGRYIQVVEGGIRPHNHADGYARRLLDADGRLPHDTLVLCPHMLRASAIPSGDVTAITSNGYEVDIESSTAVFTVRNRLVRWDRVRNCTIQLTALSGAATAQGVANNNGVARISLDTLPDGDYRLQVTPLAAETHPAGVAVGPALLNTGTPPDRLWRLLDATVTVRDGRVRSASSSDVTVAGNRVTVGLQPTWMRSPNTGLRPAGVTTNLIIVHHTGGSRASSALNTFLQTAPRRVSAHYVIDTDGQIIKMVQDSQRANHAGSAYWNGATNINNTSIGIEIVHRSGPYPEEQYRTLIGLLNQLVRDLNIPRANIVGHSDIGLCTPSSSSANCGSTVRRLGRKSSDPGETFDWTRLEAVMLGKMIVAGPVNNTVYRGFFLAAPNGHLRRGDNDADKRYDGRIRPTLPGGTIRYLQQELRRIGYYCPLTAVYDEATEWAVRMYQEHFVNPLSGRRGPNFRLGQVDADTALLIVLTG